MAGPPPYFGDAWDDDLGHELHPEAIRRMARGHLRAERWFRNHARTEDLSVSVLLNIHRTLFGDVFPDLAGRLRGPHPPDIPRDVVFGGHRAVDRDDVRRSLETLFDQARRLIRQLDDLPRDEDFTTQVITVAAWIHAEVVRIHPFCNGNGRTARACINFLAWRYGLLPLSIGRPVEPYLVANGAWLTRKDIGPLVTFLLPLCTPATT